MMVISRWLWGVRWQEDSGPDTWTGHRVQVKEPSSRLRDEGLHEASLRCPRAPKALSRKQLVV